MDAENGNFYIRGDKTRVYFFELGAANSLGRRTLIDPISDELSLIFTGSRPSPDIVTSETTTEVEEDVTDGSSTPGVSEIDNEGATVIPNTPEPQIHQSLLSRVAPDKPLFAIERLGVDRRLIVNRKRQLKMYRVWMQGVFRKLG